MTKPYIIENVKVDPQTKCWNWQQFVDKNGFGYGRAAGYKERLVHRLAYAFFKGELYPGQRVKHSCKNRRCCNPEHLYISGRLNQLNSAGPLAEAAVAAES